MRHLINNELNKPHKTETRYPNTPHVNTNLEDVHDFTIHGTLARVSNLLSGVFKRKGTVLLAKLSLEIFSVKKMSQRNTPTAFIIIPLCLLPRGFKDAHV